MTDEKFKNKLVAVLNKSIDTGKVMNALGPAQIKGENLIYYGIVLFGDWDKVTELTRKFSLWP